MLVVDSSALLGALTSQRRVPDLTALIAADGDLHAPHLLDVEVLHGLRRLLRRGELTTRDAERVRADALAMPIKRYPHAGLLDRAWALRDNLTAYDACFVALSEALGARLVTMDRRLAAAPGNEAEIVLFPP